MQLYWGMTIPLHGNPVGVQTLGECTEGNAPHLLLLD